jgi:hypothetical protein
MIPPSGIGSGCPWNIGNAKSRGRGSGSGRRSSSSRGSGSGRGSGSSRRSGSSSGRCNGNSSGSCNGRWSSDPCCFCYTSRLTRKGEHPISTLPMLPPLHVSSSPPAADAAVSASAATSIASLQLPAMTDPSSQPCLSISPRHSPSPPQLRCSPQLLSPNPLGLCSRSTTPQPNPKKRVGASQDRAEAKQGRQE